MLERLHVRIILSVSFDYRNIMVEYGHSFPGTLVNYRGDGMVEVEVCPQRR